MADLETFPSILLAKSWKLHNLLKVISSFNFWIYFVYTAAASMSLSRILMRKNVNVSKDSPIEKYLDGFVIRLDCFTRTLNPLCEESFFFFLVAVWKIANYPGRDSWPARSAYSGTTGVRASTRGSHAGTETKVSREIVCYWELMFIVIKLHRRPGKKKFEFSQQKWTQPLSSMRHVGVSISLSLNEGNWTD